MKLEVTKNTEAKPFYNLEWFSDTGEKLRTISLYEESFKALEEYFKPKAKREKKKPAPAPTLEEVKDYFKSEGYQEETAIRFFKYYESMEWYDANGKPVLRWKAKCISTWFKPENKLKVETKNTSSFFRN